MAMAGFAGLTPVRRDSWSECPAGAGSGKLLWLVPQPGALWNYKLCFREKSPAQARSDSGTTYTRNSGRSAGGLPGV
jgi:hypothetical protein